MPITWGACRAPTCSSTPRPTTRTPRAATRCGWAFGRGGRWGGWPVAVNAGIRHLVRRDIDPGRVHLLVVAEHPAERRFDHRRAPALRRRLEPHAVLAVGVGLQFLRVPDRSDA